MAEVTSSSLVGSTLQVYRERMRWIAVFDLTLVSITITAWSMRSLRRAGSPLPPIANPRSTLRTYPVDWPIS